MAFVNVFLQCSHRTMLWIPFKCFSVQSWCSLFLIVINKPALWTYSSSTGKILLKAQNWPDKKKRKENHILTLGPLLLSLHSNKHYCTESSVSASTQVIWQACCVCTCTSLHIMCKVWFVCWFCVMMTGWIGLDVASDWPGRTKSDWDQSSCIFQWGIRWGEQALIDRVRWEGSPKAEALLSNLTGGDGHWVRTSSTERSWFNL